MTRREYKFNGGHGAVLCARCRTIVCSGLRIDQPITEATHSFLGAIELPDGRVFCSPICQNLSELSAKTVHAKDYQGWVLWENHGNRNGFFKSIAELAEYCASHELTLPRTVIACMPKRLHLDADYIIDSALDDHHEDAGEEITPAEREELQTLLDVWCAKTTLVSWEESMTSVVLWEERDGEIVDLTR